MICLARVHKQQFQRCLAVCHLLLIHGKRNLRDIADATTFNFYSGLVKTCGDILAAVGGSIPASLENIVLPEGKSASPLQGLPEVPKRTNHIELSARLSLIRGSLKAAEPFEPNLNSMFCSAHFDELNDSLELFRASMVKIAESDLGPKGMELYDADRLAAYTFQHETLLHLMGDNSLSFDL